MILNTIKKRRSIRAYKPDPIPQDHIDKLAESLIWAPSAKNLQSRKFYFVQSREMLEKLVKVARHNHFLVQAPLSVVCCVDYSMGIKEQSGKRGEELYTIMDVSASIQNLMLMATELGLGTCWLGSIDEEGVKKLLNIPEYLRPVSIVTVGYPAEEVKEKPRVSKEEAVKYV